MVSKLPEKKGVVGMREILKGIDSRRIKMVIVSKNCPGFLRDKIKDSGISMDEFEGDQKELGTRLGKPFPVAMVGYEE